MVFTRLTTILAAAAVTATLSGCGADEEPTIVGPPTAETVATGAPTATEAPTDPRPTTDGPTGSGTATEATTPPADNSPTSQAPDPTDEAPQEELPTEPTAYGDLFVQAWVDQDQDLLEQLAGPDVLPVMEMWGGEGWTRGEVRQETHGAVVIDYSDAQNMELELWVQEGITQDGGPHGVVAASVSEGPYPIPDTVEDYATAFVDAAGGGAEDREYLERLATPEAAAEAQDWVSDFIWGIPEVSDGPDAQTARVTFPGQGTDVELVLLVDRELAESASEDAVLSVQPEGGPQR